MLLVHSQNSVFLGLPCLSALSCREQIQQIQSFKSIANHSSWQRTQGSLLAAIAALKAWTYQYCSSGRMCAGGIGRGRGRSGGDLGRGVGRGEDAGCEGPCTALCFLNLTRHWIQVEKTLLWGLAVTSARKQERVCLQAHIEQYFESNVSIEGEERGRFRVKGKVG